MSAVPIDEKAVFNIARRIDSREARADYLQQVCGADPEALRRVVELLQVHEQEQSFLESPAVAVNATLDLPPREKPGTQIGPYKLLEQIGEGGMGVVYLAEQKEPVERRVALKIIKPGMDTRQVIARFEAERQALAMMDHPNIAKVFDAGTTDSGRPYFVMELVNGIPVAQFCDEQHLTASERLELFIPICQAVQHAHQKGIIHRDIKPSNILVALYDSHPVPKVIDFGVAKATGGRLTDKTMFTGLGQIVGTIEYMSPEQAQRNQLDIDTRSDVYSLGVVLYELLTGDTPFDKQRLRSAAMDEMLRIIREEEPPKPSTKLSSSDTLPSVAANRKIEPAKLSAFVRGELDWIIMKALEKDRARRYETASSLAADLQHFLNDEPVVACPPSAAYRFRKFARRNKVAFVTTGIVAASLVAGLVGTSWQAIRATEAERQALYNEQRAAENERRAVDERDQKETARREAVASAAQASAAAKAEARQRKLAEAAEKKAAEEAAVARAVNEFLQHDLLGLAGAEAQLAAKIEPDPNLKLTTLLDRARAKVDERFADQPRMRAEVQATLAASYQSIGRYDEAVQLWEQAREYSEEVLGPDHFFTLMSINGLAGAYADADRFDEAIALAQQTLLRYQTKRGLEHPDTLTMMQNLAATYQFARQPDKAIPLFERAVEGIRKIRGPAHPQTLLFMNNLATAYGDAGQSDKALRVLEEMVPLMSKVLGPEHPHTLGALFNLATCYSMTNQFDKALPLHRQAFELHLKILGPEHPSTLMAMGSLGTALLQTNQPDEALPLLRSFFAGQTKQLGEDNPRLASMRATVGLELLNAKQWSEAQLLLSQSLAFREQVEPDSWKTFNTRSMIGESLLGQQKPVEAEPLLVAGYGGMKAREQQIPPMHRARLSEACERLVRLYTQLQQPTEAARWRAELEQLQSGETEQNATPPKTPATTEETGKPKE